MDGDLETVLIGLATMCVLAGMVWLAFFFAARAERRRQAHAAPDALDIVDAILTLSANQASADTRRRRHDDPRR